VKVFSSIPKFSSENKTIITIGTFDGVHLGHKVILNRLNKISKKTKHKSVLLTFFPHPRHVLQKDDQEMKLINTLNEKQYLLEKSGLDNLVMHEFTKEFSRIRSINFVRDILVEKLNVHTLVIGYDHHFGRNREGAIPELKVLAELYDFNIEMISPQLFQDVTVSSTKIRQLLETGEIEKANHYLGYHFFINGEVVKGNGIGNTIGFPTANILIKNKWKLFPADGVYAVKVNINNRSLKGMINIGKKPTVGGGGKDKSLEVHIFDFSSNIYGHKIKVRFIRRIRDEKRFEDLEGLKKQLFIDKNRAIQILG